MSAISPHAALLYVMVVASAADGHMADAELAAIAERVKALPAFADFDRQRLLSTAQECAAILSEKEGLDTVLGLAREALPPALRETAYLMALEIVLSDGEVLLEEQRALKLQRHGLGLGLLEAAALERAATARYRTL